MFKELNVADDNNYYNGGIRNAGGCNVGSNNAGHGNVGDYNAGDLNAGNFNRGRCNIGTGNCGVHNTGDQNLGDYNTGIGNIGDHNSGRGNVGSFCTEDSVIKLFDKEVTTEQYDSFMHLIPSVVVAEWVEIEAMTDEEKCQQTACETVGGYLKQIPYKEAWKKAWDNLSSDKKIAIITHECFDAVKFDQITGLCTVHDVLENAL